MSPRLKRLAQATALPAAALRFLAVAGKSDIRNLTQSIPHVALHNGQHKYGMGRFIRPVRVEISVNAGG
jgi:hypothetical protein